VSEIISHYRQFRGAVSVTRTRKDGPLSAAPEASTSPGVVFPCATSASGTCTVAANSSMICSIERVIMSISSLLPEYRHS
jgi:hypothetical protein